MIRACLSLLLAGALLALSGCATLDAMRGDLASRVDRWAGEQEYERALKAIAQVKPDHPDYAALQARVPKLERQAATYTEQVIARAAKLAGEAQWQAALEAYEEGLDKLPSNAALRQARDSFLQARDSRIEDLELRLLISRGQQLVRELPLRREIAATIPRSRDARRELADTERGAREAAQRLLVSGRTALENGDAYLAQRCLVLAATLAPSDETKAALAEARKRRPRREEPKVSSAPSETPVDRGTEALAYARSALAENDLLAAKELLQEAAALQPDDPQLAALQRALQKEIRAEVDRGIERGRRLYSQGNIEGALAVWTPLLRLEPENRQLNEHIDRAKRVLANLRDLESKEPSIKLPR